MAAVNYLWDEDNVVLETDDAGAAVAEYTYEPRQYGNLISEQRGGQTYQHHYDALGSTRLLSDESGQITDTFAYDAWGNELVRTGTTETPWRWVGEVGYYSDVETGQFYVRMRIYGPEIGRWISPDPLDFTPDQASRYAIAWNNVVQFTDPTGLVPLPVKCHTEHCTTRGPLKDIPEGTVLFKATVIGNACNEPGATIKFYLKDSKYLGRLVEHPNHRGKWTVCGQPANDELDKNLPRPGFRYGDILKRVCTHVSFSSGKDVHGCWVLVWEWECPLKCTLAGCAPTEPRLGVYGLGYGISRFSLQTGASVTFVENCCEINDCVISTFVAWKSRAKTVMGGPEQGFEWHEEWIYTPDNCTAADRARANRSQPIRPTAPKD